MSPTISGVLDENKTTTVPYFSQIKIFLHFGAATMYPLLLHCEDRKAAASFGGLHTDWELAHAPTRNKTERTHRTQKTAPRISGGLPFTFNDYSII